MSKNSKRAILIALAILELSQTQIVNAKGAVETTNEQNMEDAKEIAKKWGKIIVESADKTRKSITAPTYDVSIFREEDLWLITDIPNTDPSEERNYFFVTNKIIFWKTTTFYDANGNKVINYDKSAVRKYENVDYTSVSELGKNFVIRTDYDLQNNTFTTNFADFDSDYLWEEETPLEYGRFADVSKIIPEYLQTPDHIYTENQLKEILEVINNPEYELTGASLTKTIE